MLARDVPRVAPPVAVGVREVVRRPGIRREHDCDAMRAELPRPDDERRVAHAPVRRSRPHEVEAARPFTGADDAQQGRAVAVGSPVDPDRSRHREAARLHVLLARAARRLVREDLQAKQPRIRREPELGRLAGGVAPLRERRVDALDPHHRRGLPAARAGAAVDAVPDAKPHHVRARLGSAGRAPRQRALPGGEPPGRSPDHRRPTLAGADHVRRDHLELHLRRTGQPKAHRRRVAKPVTVRADRREQWPVAREGNRAVRYVEVEERRTRRRKGRNRGEQQGGHRLTVSLLSNDAGHN